MIIKIIFVVNFVLFNIHSNEAARILAVIPTPSISHQVAFRPLILELARRGHRVTLVTTDSIPKDQTFGNIAEIDLHDTSYKTWSEELLKTTTGKKENLQNQINVLFHLIVKVFEKQIRSEKVQDLINGKEQFDLLLAEMWVRPALAFAHLFKIPAILVSSMGSLSNINEVIGVPLHPILYPDLTRQKINDLSLWDKVTELYNHYKIQSIYKNTLDNDNKVMKKLFGNDFPTYTELTNYIQMLFVNNHPIWDNNRPIPPSVVYMGGIHQTAKRNLPKDLETYLNSSRNGVIYISFGTNIAPSMLPPEKIQMLIETFSELPYDILWKYDKDEIPGKSKNIKLFKWLPQSDLLRHPNVKLFITQGGLQSTDEAIIAGVPLIGVPMLGDQWYNVEQYVRHKIGVRLDMESLTKTKFLDTIQTVIGDESYKKNIIRLRKIIYDQPQTALDRAVWWTEYVLRHGSAEHLRSPAANMSWTEYLELKLIAVLLLSLIVLLSLILMISSYLFSLLTKNVITSIKIKSS